MTKRILCSIFLIQELQEKFEFKEEATKEAPAKASSSSASSSSASSSSSQVVVKEPVSALENEAPETNDENATPSTSDDQPDKVPMGSRKNLDRIRGKRRLDDKKEVSQF